MSFEQLSNRTVFRTQLRDMLYYLEEEVRKEEENQFENLNISTNLFIKNIPDSGNTKNEAGTFKPNQPRKANAKYDRKRTTKTKQNKTENKANQITNQRFVVIVCALLRGVRRDQQITCFIKPPKPDRTWVVHLLFLFLKKGVL